MKLLKSALVLAVLVGLGSVYAAKGEQVDNMTGRIKLGYVDFNKALNEVEEGKKAKAALQAEFNEKQKRLENAQNELKSMKENLDKQRLLLSEEALRKKEEEYRNKFMEMQQMLMTFRQEMAQREATLTKDILDKLKTIVNNIGASEGYTMILEKSQDVVLYSPSKDDLTDRVISLYNSKKFKK